MGRGRPEEHAAALLNLSESFSEIGSWVWTVEDGRVRWSAGLYRILGLNPIQTDASWEALEALVHPEDAVPGGGYDRVVPRTAMQERHFRVVRPGGEVRWLRLIAGAHVAEIGEPGQFTGIVIDMTAAKRQADCEQRFQGLVANLKDLQEAAIWCTAADGSMGDPVEWWRFSGHLVQGEDPWAHLDPVHPEDRSKVRAAWERAIREGRYRCDARVLHRGQYVESRSCASPIRDGEGRITNWIGISVAADQAPLEERAAPAATGSELSAALIRAARGLLDWTAMELSERSMLSFSTIRRMEMPGSRTVRDESFVAVRTAFEKHGVQFIGLPGGRTGVMLAP